MARRYRLPVVAYFQRIGLGAEADDLAQEVFVILFLQGLLQRTNAQKGRFRALLLGVSKNVARHYWRHKGTQRRGGARLIVSLDALPVEVAESPEAEAFDREWVKNVLALSFERLKANYPAYSAALELFLLNDKSQAEISQILGKSLRSIQHAVRRGRQKLAAYIKEEIHCYVFSQEELRDELALFKNYVIESELEGRVSEG